MCDTCGDNRFEIIEAYKRKLIEATNIETSPEEMAVIDNVLFRFWQMGWLPAVQSDVMAKYEMLKEHCDILEKANEQLRKTIVCMAMKRMEADVE